MFCVLMNPYDTHKYTLYVGRVYEYQGAVAAATLYLFVIEKSQEQKHIKH